VSSSLEARIARLEATEAVRRTFNRYLYFLDGGKVDDLLEVFATDAVMEAMNYPPGTGGTLKFETRENIAAIFRPLKPGPGRHNSANTSIAVADDARSATLTSYFVTSMPNGIQGGFYEGTLRATTDDPAGPWEIVQWRVSSQWGWRVSGDPATYAEPLDAFTLGDGRPAAR
jgi:SnoaL-like domain